MKIAFISPPITGHLNPMTTLARSVRTRGHEAVFISLPDAERSIQAAGLAFLPCGEKEYPAGSLQEWLLHLSKLQGEEALRATMTNVARRTQAMLNSLPRILALEASTFGE